MRRFDVAAPVNSYLFLSVCKVDWFIFCSLLAWLAAGSRIYHKSEGDGTAPLAQLFVDGLLLQRLVVGTKTKSQPTCKTTCQLVVVYRMCWVLVKEQRRLTHRMAALTNFTAQFVVL